MYAPLLFAEVTRSWCQRARQAQYCQILVERKAFLGGTLAKWLGSRPIARPRWAVRPSPALVYLRRNSFWERAAGLGPFGLRPLPCRPARQRSAVPQSTIASTFKAQRIAITPLTPALQRDVPPSFAFIARRSRRASDGGSGGMAAEPYAQGHVGQLTFRRMPATSRVYPRIPANTRDTSFPNSKR